MIELAIACFVIFLLIATFVKQPWNWLLIFTLGGIMAAVLLISNYAAIRAGGKSDLISLNIFLAAWLGGFIVGNLLVLLRMGHIQLSLKRVDKWWWVWGVLAMFWALMGAGALGFAYGTNVAIIYANDQGAYALYNKSMDNVAQALYYFAFAIMLALIMLKKQAITTKGICSDVFHFVEWKQIESHEWQGNKLVLYLKAKLIPRWLTRNSLYVAPDEQEAVKRLMAQQLSDKQVQSTAPIQTSA